MKHNPNKSNNTLIFVVLYSILHYINTVLIRIWLRKQINEKRLQDWKNKRMQRLFIYCDIKPTDIGFIVSHPYTDSPYLGYPDGSIIDITKIENHERFIGNM